jgi:hypothetical protein
MQNLNLSLWSGLLRIENSFTITVNPSRQRLLCYGALFLAVLTLVCSPLLPVSSLWPALWLIFLIVAAVFMANPHKLATHVDRSVEKFVLGSDGNCCFEPDKNYLLESASRAGFIGIWLVMSPTTTSDQQVDLLLALEQNPLLQKKKSRNKFIYKDSLSTRDFSRLSRVIHKLHAQVNEHPVK